MSNIVVVLESIVGYDLLVGIEYVVVVAIETL